MERLRGYLEEKERQIYLLEKKLGPQRDDSKPVRCPNCGCEKVYRNGTYKVKPKRFFDNLKAGKEELIQRFFCPYCGKSFHSREDWFLRSSISGNWPIGNPNSSYFQCRELSALSLLSAPLCSRAYSPDFRQCKMSQSSRLEPFLYQVSGPPPTSFFVPIFTRIKS